IQRPLAACVWARACFGSSSLKQRFHFDAGEHPGVGLQEQPHASAPATFTSFASSLSDPSSAQGVAPRQRRLRERLEDAAVRGEVHIAPGHPLLAGARAAHLPGRPPREPIARADQGGRVALGSHSYDVLLVAPFPTIEIIRWTPKLRDEDGEKCLDEEGRTIMGESCWFTLDNRRLYCLQAAAAGAWPKRAACVVDVLHDLPLSKTCPKKFDTRDLGFSVRLGRRNDQFNSRAIWNWQEVTKTDCEDLDGLAEEDRLALQCVREDAAKEEWVQLVDVPGDMPDWRSVEDQFPNRVIETAASAAALDAWRAWALGRRRGGGRRRLRRGRGRGARGAQGAQAPRAARAAGAQQPGRAAGAAREGARGRAAGAGRGAAGGPACVAAAAARQGLAQARWRRPVERPPPGARGLGPAASPESRRAAAGGGGPGHAARAAPARRAACGRRPRRAVAAARPDRRRARRELLGRGRRRRGRQRRPRPRAASGGGRRRGRRRGGV
ncbi:unnamed protein product, partial [Prorocentrum cordatum]